MADEDKTNWEYKTDADAASEQADDGVTQPQIEEENISWTAKEFIEHDRSGGWYMGLLLLIAIVAAAIYFVTKDYFAVGATVIVGIVALIYTTHKPQELTYELSGSGITVGQKTYNYDEFKSFSVMHEGDHTSILLEPIKRLMPPMTLYFPAEQEEQVTNAIGNHLPFEEHQQNLTERLSHRFRF